MTREAVEKVLDRVDELIVEAMNEHTAPGVSAGIVSGSEAVYIKGFGFADVEREIAVTSKSVFRIGSITKTMTAIGLMQLWEQGKFDLDDPVNNYLKGYEVKYPEPTAASVTFRHILTHTSGIGELHKVTDLFRPMVGLGARPEKSVPTPAEYYSGGLHPGVPPGTKWAYSNHAFATLGQLVEDISGEPFAQYMGKHVFEPLSMKNTDYLRSERVGEKLAQGYKFSRGRLKPVDYREIVVKGAGSVFSTAEDMSRYLVMLLNGGKNESGAVLKPETLRLMMQPHYRLDKRLRAMGLAFIVDHLDGHRLVWHNGGWPGFFSSMFVAPDHGVGVILLANKMDASFDSLAKELLGGMLGVPDLASSRLPKKGILEPFNLWPELCGFYAPEGPLNTNSRVWLEYAGEIEVFVKDGHLAMRALGGSLHKGVRLYPVGSADPLVFEALFDGQIHRVVFKRDAGSRRIEHLCLQFYKLRKRSRIGSLRFKATAGLGLASGAVFATAAWQGFRKVHQSIGRSR